MRPELYVEKNDAEVICSLSVTGVASMRGSLG